MKKAPQFFSSNDIVRICGITHRQLQWWDERGLVSPHVEDHKRLYTPEEVVQMLLASELRLKGFGLAKIRGILRCLDMEKLLRTAGQGAFDVQLLTDGHKKVHLVDSPRRVVELLKMSREPMFLVSVSDQVKRLVAAQREAA